MPLPRVLIVDDEPSVLRQLSSVVQNDLGVHVVVADSFASGRRLITSAFDGALVDLQLQDGSGLQLLRELRTHRATSSLGLMTGAVTDKPLQNEAATLGALLLLKPFPPDALAEWASAARRAFVSGRSSFERVFTGVHLSHRELESLRLAAVGLSAARISERLGVSLTTVRTYIRRGLVKSDVGSLAELRELCEGDT